MPTYDYQCEECNHKFEVFQYFKEDPLVKCPECNKDSLKRLITGGLGFSVRGNISSSLGGRYIPMDSPEQKFQDRMAELTGNKEII